MQQEPTAWQSYLRTLSDRELLALHMQHRHDPDISQLRLEREQRAAQWKTLRQLAIGVPLVAAALYALVSLPAETIIMWAFIGLLFVAGALGLGYTYK